MVLAPASMGAQTFHRLPDLPRELRDKIWRQCLPHRVVEIDLPDLEWYLEDASRQSYPDVAQRQRPCELWPTSTRNRAPPVITRVCHESRKVAFETAQLASLDHHSSLSSLTDGRPMWIDVARDTLHLHWHAFLSEPVRKFGAGPLQLYVAMGSRFHTASICADLLDAVDHVDRRAIMRCLMKRPSWSVCGAFVWIHATDEAAIVQSHLWGSHGEQRIVLVDARDSKRVAEFHKFWQTHGTPKDIETEAFFDACSENGPKIHYFETPAEFLQDLQIRWLHDHMLFQGDSAHAEELQREAWLQSPRDFDGKAEDPRQADYGNLPGRPFARQLWSPNHDHPWVQDVLAHMPDFQPTIMFRLCTNDCLSKKQHIDKNDDALED